MKLAIMQPYFLPYLGYFQLIHAVDKFVVYDNIEFTKKGWFHRNRFLVDGQDKMFSVPLKKDSDHRDVVDRELADSFELEARKILRRMEASYRKAPHYADVMPLLETCFQRGSGNLFQFIYESLVQVTDYLEVTTEKVVSSAVDIDHTLTSQEKVLAICEELGADTYVNAIGGQSLYEPHAFDRKGLDLRFLKTRAIAYTQFEHEFVPWLSIVDVMMFNPKEKIREYLQLYDLVV